MAQLCQNVHKYTLWPTVFSLNLWKRYTLKPYGNSKPESMIILQITGQLNVSVRGLPRVMHLQSKPKPDYMLPVYTVHSIYSMHLINNILYNKCFFVDFSLKKSTLKT